MKMLDGITPSLPKIDSGYAGYIGIGGVNVALDSSVRDFNVYFLFTLSIP